MKTNQQLGDDFVVFSMRANPNPVHDTLNLDHPIMCANAYRPKLADFLEMKRRVSRI